jgi:hypothetical protein
VVSDFVYDNVHSGMAWLQCSSAQHDADSVLLAPTTWQYRPTHPHMCQFSKYSAEAAAIHSYASLSVSVDKLISTSVYHCTHIGASIKQHLSVDGQYCESAHCFHCFNSSDHIAMACRASYC